MTGDKEFQELVDDVGNIYEAIRIVTDRANVLLYKYAPDLTSSQAISWALTGIKPANLEQLRQQRKLRERFASKEYQVLSLVDDKDVKHSVSRSLQQSRKHKSLIYKYASNLTEYQKARVRILTNIIWYRE